MRFPVYFKRRVGGSGSVALLGSDTAPTVSTAAFKNKDMILSHKGDEGLDRVAVGYWYEGAGPAVTLPVALWVLDETSGKWFKAGSGTLTSGEITYLKCPYLPKPPQVSANLGTPGQGVDVTVVVANNASPDGTIHIVAGPDTARF